MRIEVEGDATKLHCCSCGKTVPLQPIRPVPALGLELAGSLLPHAPESAPRRRRRKPADRGLVPTRPSLRHFYSAAGRIDRLGGVAARRARSRPFRTVAATSTQRRTRRRSAAGGVTILTPMSVSPVSAAMSSCSTSIRGTAATGRWPNSRNAAGSGRRVRQVTGSGGQHILFRHRRENHRASSLTR